MAGMYKKKTCPKCGIIHRGRGFFCSVSCSNSHREVTQETKDKLSEIQQEYVPSFLARNAKIKIDDAKHKRGEYVLQEDDWYLVPPGGDDDDGFVL